MKKVVLCAVVVVVGLFSCGLTNSERNPKNVSVAEAQNLRDGTYVRIRGAIDSALFGEWYRFSDNTGSIIIEIEDEVWARNGINPFILQLPAPFEIVGEVDREHSQNPIIEVERLKRL